MKPKQTALTRLSNRLPEHLRRLAGVSPGELGRACELVHSSSRVSPSAKAGPGGRTGRRRTGGLKSTIDASSSSSSSSQFQASHSRCDSVSPPLFHSLLVFELIRCLRSCWVLWGSRTKVLQQSAGPLDCSAREQLDLISINWSDDEPPPPPPALDRRLCSAENMMREREKGKSAHKIASIYSPFGRSCSAPKVCACVHYDHSLLQSDCFSSGGSTVANSREGLVWAEAAAAAAMLTAALSGGSGRQLQCCFFPHCLSRSRRRRR